ncbi:MAG: hypothetical protein K2J67_03965 [Lachnospiraceae bacterium]|nr:hypothetical protein [Lachnospiraceae bacterium]
MYSGYDYASTTSTANTGLLALFSGVYLMVMLVVLVIMLVANWRIYTKAGQPGWGAIVPFYNLYLLYKIAWGNGWLFLLMFVPIVNAVVGLIALYKLCVAFGHGVGFFFGMLFLSPIFTLILAFGSSEYQGPA